MKSVNLNSLEPSGPLQACNGTDLLFYDNSSNKENGIEHLKNVSLIPYALFNYSRKLSQAILLLKYNRLSNRKHKGKRGF